MNVLLVLFCIIAVLSVIILFWEIHKGIKESFVLDILEKVSTKLSQVSVTVNAEMSGALTRSMKATSEGVTMTYLRPVGENPFGLPRVLSGIITDVIKWNGCEFSSASFTIALGKENAPPNANGLFYQITLENNSATSRHVKGVIGNRILATSTHCAHFERVIVRAGGLP